jgi:hypothetical protein
MRRAGPATLPVVMLAGALLAGLVLPGCDGDQPQRATDLAPSQISAATVPEPTGVATCDVADLSFESLAGVGGVADDDVTAAVIRVRNAGPVRCEVNLAASPLADPLMEPDVWIEAGGQGELLVEHDGSACDAPSPVAALELRVNGSAVDVPITVASTCGLRLTAVYAVEPGE